LAGHRSNAEKCRRWTVAVTNRQPRWEVAGLLSQCAIRISEEIDALEVIAIKSVAHLSSPRALADGPKTGLKAVD
jgi:hypothetical protein